MSRTKWIWTLVGVVILAIILWRIFSPSHQGGFGAFDTDAPVPVTVVPVATDNVPIYLTGTGTVTPINTVNVQPQVSGQLLKLDFVEGQTVQKGDLLAQIDPRTLQAQLDQDIAKRNSDTTQLATARANLERSENPKFAPYVAQINLITQRQTAAQWKATVAADDAAIQSARVQLGFTRITSPITGVVGIRQVDPGNVVSTSTTIVTVTQMRPMDVIFTLSGTNLDEVRAAQAKAPLHVATLNQDGSVVESDGVLKVINNQIDPSTSMFQLKAEFPNTNNQLFPGQFAQTRVQVGSDAHALVVPTAAVQRGPNGEYVWLITDTRPNAPAGSTGAQAGRQSAGGAPDKPAKYVTMQAVTTGSESGTSGMIITKGLKAGDLVVTAGQFRLKEGSAVTPLKPGEIPAPPTTAQIKAAAKKGGGRRFH